ncbi:hypothetical protein ABT150_00705 [Streptomyces mirabilis]|uniref:hypothetical protein n=1 Tax=Streptomyces mirabilis TaxID=68239 RepID=UPI0033188964
MRLRSRSRQAGTASARPGATWLGRPYARQVVTAHLDEDTIRVFLGTDLITTVPRVTRKEVVVRKSGEHNRRKIV